MKRLSAEKRLFIAMVLLSMTFSFVNYAYASPEDLAVRGAVKNPLRLFMEDLKSMPSFSINKVALLEERKNCSDKEHLIDVADYKGVLLRDILEKAGMQYTRKWEPGVYIRVRGADGSEVIFSFGEIFYSSIGRSVLLAYEKDSKPISCLRGYGQLIVSTDVRAGRRITGVQEIIVERVPIELKAYEDKTKKLVRPPTSQLSLIDAPSGKKTDITPAGMKDLRKVTIDSAVMTGDCEGFHGVCSFEGILLSQLLEKYGTNSCDINYDSYIVVSSEDGFCATFSFGELFNSRLGNNIIIAFKINGEILGPKDGFARSVAGEDSTGGRSIKRINKIEIVRGSISENTDSGASKNTSND